jgi:hypothetical protein
LLIRQSGWLHLFKFVCVQMIPGAHTETEKLTLGKSLSLVI